MSLMNLFLVLLKEYLASLNNISTNSFLEFDAYQKIKKFKKKSYLVYYSDLYR
jgi:hypothetical protein